MKPVTDTRTCTIEPVTVEPDRGVMKRTAAPGAPTCCGVAAVAAPALACLLPPPPQPATRRAADGTASAGTSQRRTLGWANRGMWGFLCRASSPAAAHRGRSVALKTPAPGQTFPGRSRSAAGKGRGAFGVSRGQPVELRLPILAIAAAVALAGCGSPGHSGAPAAGAGGAAANPPPFAWLAPGPAGAAWTVVRLPSGAALTRPPGWQAVRSDPGTASFA